ncbi:hypothetical protein TW81_03780 [Vibrio galatheae]|uniref:Uncharacterized protein n=1 Tax=Vibrio galatheae TaxID=579748 RepID=A0A0F4NP84_9VIBR|nr:hypothetical protein [Vibrio galatheae]KJY84658.1 hypothetical protein TW81_03780 [Vibrio galatheae]
MTRKAHNLDEVIISELQSNGYIKSEAEAFLKKNVYKLNKQEIETIKNYAEHFGLNAKERIIEDILELRREALMLKLVSEAPIA